MKACEEWPRHFESKCSISMYSTSVSTKSLKILNNSWKINFDLFEVFHWKHVYKIWNYVETSEYCISADKQSSEVSPWPSVAPCTHVCGPPVCPITPAGYHRHPRYFYCNPETFRAIQMFRALPLLLKSIFKFV